MSLPASLPDKFDPSVPLTDPRYERFSQLRVMGVPLREACDEAGLPVSHRNAPRYDRHPEIVARKAFLAKDDADVIAATRLFCRDKLMRWASFDVLANYAIIGTATIEGRKVPRIVGIDWRKLKNSEHSSAVVGLKFDRETGMVVGFETVRPDDAVGQLRDMYGLRAPRRTELTGKGGGPVQTLDVTKLSYEQLIQLESILAAATPGDDLEAGQGRDRAPDLAEAGSEAIGPSIDLPSNGR